jgi:hypothetical protein
MVWIILTCFAIRDFQVRSMIIFLSTRNVKETMMSRGRAMEENHANNTKDFIGIHQQVEWLNGSFQPNFILRFENLKNDFKEMLDACEIKHITADIPHENSSKRSDYKDYYNSKTQKIIEKIFEKDIDTFKYLY